jgi:hypothetical protein
MAPLIVDHPHVARGVLMVRPVDFSYNEQTATDNEFQHMPVDCTAGDVNSRALIEFDESVSRLRNAGVEVVVLDYPITDSKRIKTPDAVFCNNWFTTHPTGEMYLYPLSTPNRREETKRIDDVKKLFIEHGYIVNNISRVGNEEEDQHFLESTGSMVFDHVNGVIYAARSIRMHDAMLEQFMKMNEHYKKAVVFDTISSNGLPFYHTNVMMSIGDRFAVVCSECIQDKDRQFVLDELKKDREVIEITLAQAEKYFCGNILQLKSCTGEFVIAMSASCLTGFSQEQLAVLNRHGKLVPFPISDTIEFVGGGSARCMLGEIFLPKRTDLLMESLIAKIDITT